MKNWLDGRTEWRSLKRESSLSLSLSLSRLPPPPSLTCIWSCLFLFCSYQKTKTALSDAGNKAQEKFTAVKWVGCYYSITLQLKENYSALDQLDSYVGHITTPSSDSHS